MCEGEHRPQVSSRGEWTPSHSPDGRREGPCEGQIRPLIRPPPPPPPPPHTHRSEKRRVRNFVCLLDYLVCDALHALVASSIDDMAAALTPAPSAGPSAATLQGLRTLSVDGGSSTLPPASSELDLAALTLSPHEEGSGPDSDALPAGKWGMPLLRVTVRIDPETDELYFEPEPEAFLEHMAQVGLVPLCTPLNPACITWLVWTQGAGMRLGNPFLPKFLSDGPCQRSGFSIGPRFCPHIGPRFCAHISSPAHTHMIRSSWH